MKYDFELLLEECLAQIRNGMTLEDCLSAHPTQARKLRPLLEAAIHVRKIPLPLARPEAVQAGLEHLLANPKIPIAANSTVSSGRISRYTKHRSSPLPIQRSGMRRLRLSTPLRWAVTLVFVLLAGNGITIRASASSLPGDILYGVKRTWESVRLSLTANQQGRLHLHEQFAEERLEEIQALIKLRRSETVEFEAPLQEINIDHWQVDGLKVFIDSDTEIQELPEMGQELYIRALLNDDGTLTALQVRNPDFEETVVHPTRTPSPSITPNMDSNPENEDKKTHEAIKTPKPTELEATEEDEESGDPQQKPQKTDTPNPNPHVTHTPQSTEYEEHVTHTPQSTEYEEDESTPEPEETQRPSHTPEASEQPHETTEATDDD